jgi:molybdate transport system ATP-binding protein
VDVALEGQTVLRRIRWRLLPGQHWAVLGGNGSGKSTLLRLIRGELWPAPDSGGERVYTFEGETQTTAVGIREKIALVSPELQGRYLQQSWTLTAGQVILSGIRGGDYVYRRPTTAQVKHAQGISRLLGVEDLLRRDVQQLSSGELRKVLIARALAGSPRVLLCDEICDGLQPEARSNLLACLGRIAGNGTQLIYATHRREELLPVLTHQLTLERGRIVARGPVRPRARRSAAPTLDSMAVRSDPGAGMPREPAGWEARPMIVCVRSAEVWLRGQRVLRNLNFEIRAGEHWAILGPNGSGKTTLLKLIFGDWPPALGGLVRRFAFRPGTSVWEVRRRIAYVGPELQARYTESVSGADAIASGFFSSIGLREKLTSRQRMKVRELMDRFQLRALAGRSVRQMSYGELRKILLARALVQSPALLLCDEPFDGLDAASRVDMRSTLADVAGAGTGLVIVTHHPEDLPACMTHVAQLQGGRLVFQGSMAVFQSRESAARS